MLNYIAYLNARRLEKNKKWKPAFEAYKKIAKDPKNTPAKLAYRIGFVAEKVKDWKSAEAWLTKAVKGQSDKAQWIYRLGFAQEKNKKYAAAIGSYNKALKINPDKAEWIYRSGLCHELLKKYPEAKSCYEAALEKQPATAEWQYRLGKVLWLSGQSASAEAPLRKAMELEPENALYAHELSVAIRKQGRTWQEVEALEHTLALDPGKAQWQFEQGEAQDRMNRFAEASHAFQEANRLQPGNAMWHYREGYAWERADERKLADAAYTAARACDKDLKAKIFGIGAFHQHRGLWPQAAAAYENEANLQPFNGELLYRLGLAQERCYIWEKAAACYKQALVIEPSKPDWHYRLGFVLERQGLLKQAAQAYEYAATTRATHTPYWFYRLGYVLAGSGEYEKACTAFLHTRTDAELSHENASLPEAQTSLSNDYLESLKENLRSLQKGDSALRSKDQAAAFYKLGNQAERLRMWEEAAQAYRSAVIRSSTHNSLWYYRLGYALMQLENFSEAASAFCETRVFKRAHGVDMSRHEKNAGLIQVMEYTEYLDTLPVCSNMVLYESYAGVSVSCNPYAIYQAIVDEPEFSDWTHVWVLNDLTRIPSDWVTRENVVFVARDSQLYLRYLATAGWLINNSTFQSYFIRRDEQRYLNTWHGTPLKTLGMDIRGSFMGHGNTARNLLHSTHVISPNPHTSKVLIERYDIDGLYQGQLAQTGYPRNDLVINATAEQKAAFRQKLGLKEAGKPLVLYAPTWRGILGHPEVDSRQLIADLQALQKQDCQIVFRGHYFAEKALAAAGLDNIHIAPQAVDTSELLSITDVLITDYSSIFFDYLPTGRPILFYTYDLEQYQNERGLYFGMDEMPGANCETLEQLGAELARALQLLAQDCWAPDAQYVAAQLKFSPNDDGQATQRVVDFFFKNNSEIALNPNKDERRTLLFYVGPFTPMGITTAAINLISALNPEKYCVAVAIDPDAVSLQPERLERLSRLPDHIHVIGRVGRKVCSAQEKLVVDSFHLRNNMSSQEHWDIYDYSYKREFKRMFGNWNPDYVVNYDGYSKFWSGLMSFGPVDNVKKIIYQHSDMYSECCVRFPSLEGIFRMYFKYDALVSVAKAISEKNKENLADRFDIPLSKFSYADNVPDFDGVYSRSLEPLQDDLQEMISDVPKGQLFVSIGRLSPEKNYSLLLDSFSVLLRKYPDAKLVVLGDGPLRKLLEEKVKNLNISNSAFFPGVRSNPFPLLRRSDCFTLSSLHEGQPMVLLESMVLKKAIIATRIPGVIELLSPGYGKLVDLTIEEYSEALIKFVDNGNEFSMELKEDEFKKNVIDQFLKFIN